METIAAALMRPRAWPEPGGWHAAVVFGTRSWVSFTAFLGGIEVDRCLQEAPVPSGVPGLPTCRRLDRPMGQ